ncbi:hypothetical protein GCM10023144_25720 [Pigmentiphaga soli]|uniref:Rieske domain-containing protein n=2 Tax=Pigmentiphaga soli TaxID=1007095 RepID=A0ABP8H3R6_9BURK
MPGNALPAALRELGGLLRAPGPISPPAGLERDRDVFVFELRALFFSQWLALGAASAMAAPGARAAYETGPRSYLAVRDTGGELRVFRNRCPHAGHVLFEDGDSVASDQLVCKYHGWRFALDGRAALLPHLPESARATGIALEPLPIACRHGLLFVDPRSSEDRFGEAPRLQAPAWMEHAAAGAHGTAPTAANWKTLYWRVPALLARLLGVEEAGLQWQRLDTLGFLAHAGADAVLLRLSPRGSQDTAVRADWLHAPQAGPAADTAPPAPAAGPRSGADGHRAGRPSPDAAHAWLAQQTAAVLADAAPAPRAFFDWYWNALGAPTH